MALFYHNEMLFELTTPEYEKPVFGFKVGELRSVNPSLHNSEAIQLDQFQNYLKNNEILICTFRGNEDVLVIRVLEELGFKFVSTYNVVECTRSEFKKLDSESKYLVEVAKESDYHQILEIEKLVKDFSTFSIDPLISEKASSTRNVIRVKSHFNKDNHRIYIVKIDNQIAGFIQFILDYKNLTAHTLNAAINPKFQKIKIGKSLFSDSFQDIFKDGFDLITSDYGTQNIGSAKLHQMCNFKIVEQNIHYRLFL